jgi:hypothetical protein
MRSQILAGVTVLTFTAGAMTSAMAFDHKTHSGGGHARGFHAAGIHSVATKRHSRLSGVRAAKSDWNHGGYIDLGPLGMMAACGAYHHKRGYCGPGYSVSTFTY